MMTLEQKAIYTILHTNGIGKVKGRKIIDMIDNVGIMIRDIISIRTELLKIIN